MTETDDLGSKKLRFVGIAIYAVLQVSMVLGCAAVGPEPDARKLIYLLSTERADAEEMVARTHARLGGRQEDETTMRSLYENARSRANAWLDEVIRDVRADSLQDTDYYVSTFSHFREAIDRLRWFGRTVESRRPSTTDPIGSALVDVALVADWIRELISVLDKRRDKQIAEYVQLLEREKWKPFDQIGKISAQALYPICTTDDPVVEMPRSRDERLQFASRMSAGLVEYDPRKKAAKYVWDKDPISVHFLDGDEVLKNWVKTVAEEWTRYANIRFDFEPPSEKPADIRITFREDRGVFWSAIGTLATTVDLNKATMSLGGLSKLVMKGWEDYRPYVLHEFGHTLGLLHEHQSPNAPELDEEGVLRWFKKKKPGWLEKDQSGHTMVETEVLNRYPRTDVRASTFDSSSIMIYEIHDEWTKNGKGGTPQPKVLSEQDKKFIGTLYPRKR